MVYISGTIYTARDAAHQRLCEMLEQGEPMPFDFKGQAVYYADPVLPKRETHWVGRAPPIADEWTPTPPPSLNKVLKWMIGKGLRSAEVIESLKSIPAFSLLLLAALRALMAQCVESAQVIAFDDLGTEAIRKISGQRIARYCSH